jgi:hypothetical protein
LTAARRIPQDSRVPCDRCAEAVAWVAERSSKHPGPTAIHLLIQKDVGAGTAFAPERRRRLLSTAFWRRSCVAASPNRTDRSAGRALLKTPQNTLSGIILAVIGPLPLLLSFSVAWPAAASEQSAAPAAAALAALAVPGQPRGYKF